MIQKLNKNINYNKLFYLSGLPVTYIPNKITDTEQKLTNTIKQYHKKHTTLKWPPLYSHVLHLVTIQSYRQVLFTLNTYYTLHLTLCTFQQVSATTRHVGVHELCPEIPFSHELRTDDIKNSYTRIASRRKNIYFPFYTDLNCQQKIITIYHAVGYNNNDFCRCHAVRIVMCKLYQQVCLRLNYWNVTK